MWLKIQAISSSVWLFLRPLVVLLISESGKALAASAIRAVQEAQTDTTLSSAQKRGKAARTIKADMEAASYSVAESAINMALEMAVQKMKAE